MLFLPSQLSENTGKNSDSSTKKTQQQNKKKKQKYTIKVQKPKIQKKHIT